MSDKIETLKSKQHKILIVSNDHSYSFLQAKIIEKLYKCKVEIKNIDEEYLLKIATRKKLMQSYALIILYFDNHDLVNQYRILEKVEAKVNRKLNLNIGIVLTLKTNRKYNLHPSYFHHFSCNKKFKIHNRPLNKKKLDPLLKDYLLSNEERVLSKAVLSNH